MDTNLLIVQIKEYPKIGDQEQAQQVKVSLIDTSKVTIKTNVKITHDEKDSSTFEQ